MDNSLPQMTETDALEFTATLIQTYKEHNAPFVLDEELTVEQVRQLHDMLYQYASVEAQLKEAGIMLVPMGTQFSVCTKQDLIDAGAIFFDADAMDDLEKRHGGDADAAARELVMIAQQAQPKVH